MAGDPFLDLLDEVSRQLEEAGLQYAVTGSVASSVYGEPITSQDVDICLRMTALQAAKLADLLPPRFYRSEKAMQDAARDGGLANLVDTQTGLKIDLSVLPREPFYDQVLGRRRRVDYGQTGKSFWTVSPEDIVLMKLLWRKDTQSRKQWDNALSVVRVQGSRLDWGYLVNWAGRLDLSADLQTLKEAAGI